MLRAPGPGRNLLWRFDVNHVTAARRQTPGEIAAWIHRYGPIGVEPAVAQLPLLASGWSARREAVLRRVVADQRAVVLPEEVRDLPVPPRGALRKRGLLTRPNSTSGHGGGSLGMRDPIQMEPPGGGARSARGCYGADRSRRRCGDPGPRCRWTRRRNAVAQGS